MLSRSNWRVILGFLLLIVLTIGTAFLFVGDVKLHVYFFDVGQGDSILVKKGDFELLIDGGPDSSVLAHLGRTLPPWDRTIEIVVLTHPHADHLTGLVEVLRQYEVGEVWGTGIAHTSEVYLDFLEAIRDGGVSYRVVSEGLKTTVYDLTIEVLYPMESFQDKRLDNLNLSSIVLRMTHGEFSTLLTGDAEKAIQQELVGRDSDLTSRILKIPHQGSRDADLPTFLDRVKPSLAVLSVGTNNQYGHPHAEVLAHYERLNIPILRTDHDGTIHLSSDGTNLWIRTAKRGIVTENVWAQQMVTDKEAKAGR